MLMLMLAQPAKAEDLTWVPTGPQGSGTWDTTTAQWFDGTVTRPWSNLAGDSATFGGPSGTVVLIIPMTIQNLDFLTDGYLLQGAALNFATASSLMTVTTETASIASSISGNGTLIKAGAGTLTLSGINIYTGDTTVNGGTIQVSTDNNLGAANGVLTLNGGTLASVGSFTSTRNTILGINNGSVDVASGQDLTLSGVISGIGNLTQANAGTLVLTGANTYTGSTSIAGVLQVGNGGATGQLGAGNAVNNGTLIFNLSTAYTYAGLISGSGGLTQNGTGTTVLSGANSYTGNTTINVGALQVSADNNLGAASGALVLNGGSLVSTATFNSARSVTLNSGLISTTAGILSLGGQLSGGPLTKSGSGTLVLSNTGNNYVGDSTINGGTLQIASNAALGNVSGNLVFNNGTLSTSAGFSSNRNVLLNSGQGAFTPTTGTLTLNGLVSGAGQLVMNGAGTLVLAKDLNSYSGGTLISAGTLSIASDASLGTSAGALLLQNGTLQTTTNLVTNRNVAITGVGGLSADAGTTLTVSSQISGAGNLHATGAGTLLLTANNTYTGGTSLYAGTLQIASDANLGAATSGINFFGGTLHTTTNITTNRQVTLSTGSGSMDVDSGTLFVLNGGVGSAGGGLTKIGNGTLVLAADNTYSGQTIINSGTLQVGNGGATGTLGTGSITNHAALVFNRSGSLTVSSSISGAGIVSLVGPGTTVFTGNNTYTGATNVAAGALYINGSQTSATGLTSVASGATLGGVGTMGGTVVLANGATLAPGGADGAIGTLSINGNLVLDNGSTLNYRFGQVGVAGGLFNDLVSVNGNLTLGGTLNITQTPGGLFETGVYRVFNYSGLLTNNILNMGSLPTGISGTLQTSIANQINLIATSSTAMFFWDGGLGAASQNNQVVDGGSGVWQGGSGNSNWTDTNGAANGPWATNAYAIFEAAPGTVTVDNATAGNVSNAGMQFAVDGYHINGDPLTLVETTPSTGTATIRVGDGTVAGAGYTATIGSVLQGSVLLRKTDLGTLVLTGANTYTGGTLVLAGTLQLGDGVTDGSIVGDVSTGTAGTTTGTLAFNPAAATTLSYSGVISGLGSVRQMGNGTTVLTGHNTYTGGTTISAGTLQVGDGTTSGSLVGPITDNGVLVFKPASGSSSAVASAISGSGQVQQVGLGTTVLTGVSTYTGGTLISAGTLQLGDGTTTGSIVGDVVNNGSLSLASGSARTLNGVISGSGAVHLIGGGTVTLTGDNTYAGGTFFNGGTLRVTSDNNLGAASGGLSFNGGSLNTGSSLTLSRTVLLNGAGTFNVDGGTTLTLATPIQGAGSLEKTGGGLFDLSAMANTYSGGTKVDSGTLRIASDSNLGAVSGSINMNGGTLNTTADITTNRKFFFNLGVTANFDVNTNTTLTIENEIDGIFTPTGHNASLAKNGNGTLILAANNRYGLGYGYGVNLNGGTLQIGNGGSTGSFGGPDPSVIQTGSGTTLVFNRNNAFTLTSSIVGAGQVQQFGTGTTTLTGNSSYTGGTLISAGQMTIAEDANLGATSSALTMGNSILRTTASFALSHSLAINTAGATLDVATGTTLTANGVIADGNGVGGLTKTDTGTLVLTAANTYSGGTTINGGVVQVAADNNLGSTLGALSLNNATLAVSNSFVTSRAVTLNAGGGTFNVGPGNTLTDNGLISGTGALIKTNLGALVLSGDNNYSGSTTVAAGSLMVNGNQSAATGLTTVAAGGTFGGNGTIGGDVVINNGATLAPRLAVAGPGTLTINGNVTVNSGANLSYTFGIVAGLAQNDLVNVGGNLTLGGLLNVSIAPGGTLDPGVYRVFNYSGSFTDNNLAIGSVPTATTLTLQKTIPGQINLVNTTGQRLAFWDGSVVAQKNNGSVDGGNGIWNYAVGGVGANDSWTDPNGAGNSTYSTDSFAVFQGSAGTVTVDNSLGQVQTSGLQFLSNGYVISGDPLSLIETASGSGSTAIQVSQGATATIRSVLQGTVQLRKTDLGTLILRGANTYSGGTAINGGVLQVASDGNLGDAAGTLSLNGATLSTTGSFSSTRATTLDSAGGTFDVAPTTILTLNGVLTGAGALSKTSTGTLVLNGANTYTGGTVINGGVLQVVSDSNLGAAAGALSLNGGTLSTTGSFSSTRATTLNGAGGTFDVAPTTTLTLNGVLTGAGALSKTSTGTLVLNGANTYTGGTVINGGVLQVVSDSNLGAAAGALSLDGGTLSTTGSFSSTRATTLNSAGGTFDVAPTTTLNLNGVLAGSGALSKTSTGTLVLSGANTYSGGTVINGGVLQVANDGNLGDAAGALSLNGGILSTTGSFSSTRATTLNSAGGTFDVASSTTLNLNGVLAGSGALSKTSTGTLVLNGVNTYSGGTAINGGVLQVANDGNLGDAAGALSLNGGILSTTGSFSSTRATTLNSAGGTFDVASSTTLNLNGVLAGSGALSKTSTGTLVLNGVNTYSGGTAINGGVLQVASDGNLGDAAGALSLNGGTLRTTGSFSSTRATTLNGAGGTFDVASSATLTLNGVLAGSGALSKTSTGTLVLSGANSYSGGTEINGGVLQVASDSNLGAAAGGLSLDGGTLHATSSLTTTRAVVLNAGGGTLDVDAGDTLTLQGLLTGSGALTKDLGGTLVLTADNTYGGATTLAQGTLQLGAGGTTGSLGTGDVLNNATLIINRSNTYTYGGVISGTGTVQQVGSGTTVLNGSNIYSGGTAINGGVLQVANDGNLGDAAGALSLNGGILSTTGSFSSTRATTLNSAGGTFDVASSTTLNLNGVLAGSGALSKTSTGTLVLSGANTYTGGTAINGGVLQVANDGNLGDAAGALSLNGGTLRTTVSFSSTRATTLNGAGGTFDVAPTTTLTLNGVLAGSGALSKTSTGTLVLNGVNTYSGGTAINGGVLQVASDSNLGAAAGGLSLDGGTLHATSSLTTTRAVVLNAGGGTLDVDAGDTLTLQGLLTGSGALTKDLGGTLVLTADNTYGGATTLAQGTLQLGAGGTTGSLGTGDVLNNATLIINRSNTYTYGGVIAGTGTVQQVGSGTTVLSGSNTYSGTTTVTGGTLLINGNQAGAQGLTTVATGATLGGKGTVGGNLVLASGATLTPGDALASVGALTINGDLTINNGVNLAYQLGAANVVGGPMNDLVSVGGDLTLSGQLNVTVPTGGTFDVGVYRLFNYGGVLHDNSLTIATAPVSLGNLSLQRSQVHEVNLINTSGQTLSFWDGSLLSGRNNATVDGGDGTWNYGPGSTENWTDATGSVNAPYVTDTYAIFQGQAGTVTVDNSLGAIRTTGMQFLSDGYVIKGDPVTLLETVAGSGSSAIQVNPGVTASIDAVLQGAVQLRKTNTGTLVLSGVNTYTGGTAINGGVLQVVSDSNLGDAAGALSLNGGTLRTTGSFSSTRATTLNGAGGTFDVASSATLTLNGVLAGSGALSKTSTGTLVLSGANSYSGGTEINGGVLQVASDSNLGAAAGGLSLDGGTLHATSSLTTTRAVVLNAGGGTLDVDAGDTLTLQGLLTGSGALTKDLGGTLVLTADNTYGGATTLAQGTLQLGAGGTTGSLGTGDVLNNATLIINRSNTYTYGGVIAGTGTVQQVGSGTTVLNGSNIYSGGTAINGGVLQVANDGNLGDAAGALSLNGGILSTTGSFSSTRATTLNSAGGTFDVASSTTLNLNGVLAGSGALSKTSAGTLVLTADNSYGATTLAQGTLQLGAGGTTGSLGTGDVVDNATLIINRSNTYTYGGVISGTGTVQQVGSGTTVLSGSNTYSGGTAINGGVLQVASDSNLGAAAGGLSLDGGTLHATSSLTTTRAVVLNAGGGTLDVDAGDTLTLQGLLTGSGALTKDLGGTLVLTADNTYGGATTLAQGTLQLGAGGTTGSLGTGDVLNNATLIINRSNTYTYGGVIAGTGTVQQVGSGTTVLSGSNTYSGTTTVTGGTLLINGNQAGAQGLTTVATGATLGGKGTVGGNLVLASGATLTPGDALASVGALTINGDLTINNGVNLAYQLGAANVVGGPMNDLVSVGGDLTLSGQLNVTVPTGGTFDVGVYRLFNYGGVLHDNSLTIATAPVSLGNLSLQRSQVHEVNLINTSGQTLSFWDGSLLSGRNNATVDGGDGTWNYGPGSTENWTDATGSVNAPYVTDTYAIFQGQAGTVTVDNSLGAIRTTGMQFLSDGYVIKGDPVTLLETVAGSGSSAIQVNPGVTASIDAVLQGAVQLRKTNTGTLVLSGVNTYTGGTAINGGVLQVVSDSNLGDAAGALSLNGGTLRATVSFSSTRATTLNGAGGTFDVAPTTTLTLNGVLAGSGALSKTSTGTLVLSGANSYTGGTEINSGVLQVARDSNLGDAGGALSLSGGTLRSTASFSTARAITLNGTASTFALAAVAPQATPLDSTGGIFDVASSTTLNLNGVLTGSGALSKTNTGTLVLNGVNTYSGGTAINGGVLQVASDGNLGAAAGGLSLDGGTLHATSSLTTARAVALNAGGGTFEADAGDTLTLQGLLSGSGALSKDLGGAVVLTADNSYGGVTTLAQGTLQLGVGGTTGSLGTGDVLNNAILIVNRSNTYTYGGVISGTGTVQQVGSGTTVLSGLNTYRGKTTVSAGRLQAGATNAFSNASDYTIAQGAVLDTAGFNQTLASLDNSGTVSLAGAAPGTTLTVQGAYVGRDGVVQLSSVLGDSGSVTDRLVLNGAQASTMGHTTLSITNKGGLGALTRGDGIVVVSAQNGATTTAQTTKDAFTLANGHVDAGAYQYRLYAADANGAGEDWFLRSTTDGGSGTGPSQPSKPTYRADVPVYVALPDVIRQGDLAMLSTLHGRVGDQSTGTTAGAESANRVWTRTINNRSSIEQKGTTSPRSDTSAQGMQVGLDLSRNSDWNAGVYAGQLRLDSDVKGQYGLSGSAQAGSLKSDSQYLGGYASYANQKNQYADFVLQYGHHDMSGKAGNGTHHSAGNSVTASAEVGQRFALNAGWGDLAIEPQAQLIVNQQNLGHTRISGDTTVAQSPNMSVIGRAGLRLTGAFDTKLGRLEPYARVDLWHGFDATDTTHFKTPAAGTTTIHNGIGYTSTEVATGFTLALNKSTSVYAEVGDILSSGTGQAKVGSTLQSSVGIKVSW
ncbi:autotransporter-associated beta strand protein [Pseudomonas fluorescens]|uniref:autotransporter-associated beta strand repeat-containing protein n=1 Tax=Pseudomonas fluorescens TaxID=294 RepID=UPI00209CDF66|nr:autotransporter-associated beta strand repeat-containing protein [Pseudomonas fluorescens]MCP1489941.1 autotransporter-associated beta strand protein [Pseudomonas fluorescens]